MGNRLCAIRTDKGELFIVFDNVIDQFISPAVPSLQEAASFLDEFDTTTPVSEIIEAAKKNAFDLRRETIHKAVRLLAKLKTGRALSVPDACVVANFYLFLQATVAPHQYTYTTLDAVVARSRTELGLDKKFPDYDNWELVTDLAVHPAFLKKYLDRKFPKTKLQRLRASKEQLKLAGRYVSTLALIANIAGPGKSTPKAVVQTFFDQMMTVDQGAVIS